MMQMAALFEGFAKVLNAGADGAFEQDLIREGHVLRALALKAAEVARDIRDEGDGPE